MPTYLSSPLLLASQNTTIQSLNPLVSNENKSRQEALIAQGFVSIGQMTESHLDLTTIDRQAVQHRIDERQRDNITISTYSALMATPDIDEKLFDLVARVVADAPFAGEKTQLDASTFKSRVIDNPAFPDEGFFLATHNDALIGMSSLLIRGGFLYSHLTGVQDIFRGHGIATILKWHTIAYGIDHGYDVLRTLNDTQNQAILRLNERLGFQPHSIWTRYARPS